MLAGKSDRNHQRYVKGVFPQSKGMTIGVEFASKNITLQKGTKVKAQIWDTGKGYL